MQLKSDDYFNNLDIACNNTNNMEDFVLLMPSENGYLPIVKFLHKNSTNGCIIVAFL